LEKLKEEISLEDYTPLGKLVKELWGIKFRSPIMNAAGMFKNGECYEMVAKQRAGISLNQWHIGYFENFAEHGMMFIGNYSKVQHDYIKFK